MKRVESPDCTAARLRIAHVVGMCPESSVREGTNLLTPQPSRETLRASGIARQSAATVSAGLRTASKGSLPPDQNQTCACGASGAADYLSGLPGLRFEKQE
ncbi:hypothetical protein SFRURICE_011210 [Spodoptera frugiperda]|nr:hypothetical protein SFRURICE_011210 [Spodoptera frugiperda]